MEFANNVKKGKKKLSKLSKLLKRLNDGENPASARKEAKEFLASIGPQELSFAEQKILEDGLKPEDLRHLCSIHLETMNGEIKKIKAKLQPGHVIHTFVSEHDLILGFLDELEKVNKNIQKMKNYQKKNEEFKCLTHISNHLIGAEAHYKREEEVLFPEIEKRGVFGPPQIMRMEHKDLKKYKKELKKLVENNDKVDFNEFKKCLDAIIKSIIRTLKDHIFKENNILYPVALEVIKKDITWQKMKGRCDKIGYCCFTPKN